MTTSDDHHRDLAGEVGRLQRSVAELAEVTRTSNATTLEAMRRRTRLERIVLAVSAVVILGMVAVGWGIWQVHSAQNDTKHAVGAIRSAQADSRETLRTIKDCTDPTGACSRRNQEQTAVVVGSITDGSTVGTFCALAHPGDLPAARACVKRALAP